MAYPGFARGGCPKNYVHEHNVGGRGLAHVKFDRARVDFKNRLGTTTGQPVNSALCLLLAIELIPAYF